MRARAHGIVAERDVSSILVHVIIENVGNWQESSPSLVRFIVFKAEIFELAMRLARILRVQKANTVLHTEECPTFGAQVSVFLISCLVQSRL